MAISLVKGQKVSLDNSMKLALVGLGWDTNRYDGGYDFDLDASAFLLGDNGKLQRDEDFIFYNNLESRNKAVVHTGDNLTGDGDGDDEVIMIDFTKIPDDVKKNFLLRRLLLLLRSILRTENGSSVQLRLVTRVV